jgi:hypothetical protein
MTARKVVLAYYAWAAREVERQCIVDEADALESIGGELHDGYPKENESETTSCRLLWRPRYPELSQR